MPENQLIKFLPIKQGYQLTEQTRMTYHGVSSLVFWDIVFLGRSTISHKEDIFINDSLSCC